MAVFGNIVEYDGLYYKVVAISDDETPTYTLSPLRRKTEAIAKTVTTGKNQNFLVPDGSRIVGVNSGDIEVVGDRTAMSKTLEYGIFRLKFDSNGGSEVASQYIEADGTATEPTDPTLEGYTFDGWYVDEELTEAMDFAMTFDDDLVIYAKWTEDV